MVIFCQAKRSRPRQMLGSEICLIATLRSIAVTLPNESAKEGLLAQYASFFFLCFRDSGQKAALGDTTARRVRPC